MTISQKSPKNNTFTLSTFLFIEHIQQCCKIKFTISFMLLLMYTHVDHNRDPLQVKALNSGKNFKNFRFNENTYECSSS